MGQLTKKTPLVNLKKKPESCRERDVSFSPLMVILSAAADFWAKLNGKQNWAAQKMKIPISVGFVVLAHLPSPPSTAGAHASNK